MLSENWVFSFDFMTLTQHFDLNGYKLEGHSGRSLDWNRLEGTITSNDVSSIDEIAERVHPGAGSGSFAMVMSWRPARHRKFKVDSIQRTSNPRTLIMASDGESFSELVIPALDDFSLLSAQVSQLRTKSHPDLFEPHSRAPDVDRLLSN